jgi:hypothetical protein
LLDQEATMQLPLFPIPPEEPGKVCSTCRRWKPLRAYNRRSTAPDGRQWACRECNAAYHALHKDRLNQMIHRRNKKLRRAHQLRILRYLLDHPCADCGETDPVVLEFDHLHDKRANVGELTNGYSWATVAAEIAKCDVVCVNCHRRRTFAREQSWRVAGHPREDGQLI